MSRRLFVWGVLACLGGGCASPPPVEAPEPCERQVVTAAIISTAHINPAENGEARPVQLRLYQLKNDVGFRNASFDGIWKDDAKELGEDLLGAEEISVYPDSRKELNFERNPEAQYIVAAALFRTPKGKHWFTTFDLPPVPGQEACGAKCEDGECAEPPQLNPKVYIRVDGTRVDDGSDYADDFPAQSVAVGEQIGKL